jgi:DNA-binding XRE family transcriptional regulator
MKDFLGPARPTSTATHSVPGSVEHIAVLAERAAKRQALFCESDQAEEGVGLRIEVSRNGKPLVVGTERAEAEKALHLTVGKLRLFCERLVYLKRRRELSTRQLADRSGLSWQGIYWLEKGLREPTLATALLLAGALSIPLGILAGEAPARS